jgi:type II secretory pathway component PulC
MSQRLLRLGLVLLAISAVLAGALALTRPVVVVDAPVPSNFQHVTRPAPHAVRPDSLLHIASARAPFRAARVPSRVPFDPAGNVPASAPPASAPTPRPVLVLSGIVWGPDPSAVLEGVPGSEGARVVRRRDRVGGLAVRSIERDRVIISAPDTTWTLHVKEPWK